ncbi:hypothetical protein [Salinarimonas soli]|uniref:Protein phosphatase 2C domain-containing protein n=1 Tax=Salinarimonas soli TaxID=1638099 RepID=A0A5B2VCJ2_9HYPH|nr:hypothetical protein [Salinarimonas soli]KAA2236771.1 hypothetical protein F0L46_13465 [Salinarimonas soli]
MLIEAFTEAKNPAAPDTNEDRFVCLPGRGYAVIDGVTDRLGTRYDGMLSGQYAATIVKAALEHELARPGGAREPRGIVAALTAAIADAYRSHGILESARTDWNQRFSATLALVLVAGENVDVLLVGDSGVRINGSRLLQVDKDLDLITAALRRTAWPVIGRRAADAMQQEAMSRRITWFGTRQSPGELASVLSPDDIAGIERQTIDSCVRALPHVPAAHIETLVRGGIVHAQGAYQNDSGTILGYSSIDGFEVPFSLVHLETLPRADVQTIELFTDGYFKPGASFGVASWEEAFREVEAEDPAKVLIYPSPKGSTAAHWADDRTYLGVRL